MPVLLQTATRSVYNLSQAYSIFTSKKTHVYILCSNGPYGDISLECKTEDDAVTLFDYIKHYIAAGSWDGGKSILRVKNIPLSVQVHESVHGPNLV